MKLKFKYHFDAAHRLEEHQGKCYNLHGHRWEVLLELEQFTLDVKDMIVDFGELKKILNEYDHTCILRDCTENSALIKVLNKMDSKVILLAETPTVENLTKVIHKHILNSFGYLDWVNVTIWESVDASVEI